MIHIVSGMYRSGTSAMMQALIAGGMTSTRPVCRGGFLLDSSEAVVQ